MRARSAATGSRAPALIRHTAAAMLSVLSVLTPLATPVSSAAVPLTLRTDDGVAIAATWYPASARPAPAVILVHMLGRSRRDWEELAGRLAADGVSALTIDLRGHGESRGAIGTTADGQQDLKPMVLDVRAARKHLAERGEVLAGRLGLAGASLGANLVGLEAGDPAVKSMALLSPSLEYRGLRIEPAVRKLTSRALLLVASDNDPYALRSARELHKAAGGGGTRELLVLPQAGHGTAMLARHPDLNRALVDWFRRTLL